jgi:hypothetical protein
MAGLEATEVHQISCAESAQLTEGDGYRGRY